MKPDYELEVLVNELKKGNESMGNWVEVTRPVLPRLEYNVYAYLDYGKILSNGLHESKIGTVSIKYNGEVYYHKHL